MTTAKQSEIPQATLQRIHFSRYQIRQLQRELNELSADLFAQLEAGANVEPGTHVASIVQTCSGGTILEKLVVHFGAHQK